MKQLYERSYACSYEDSFCCVYSGKSVYLALGTRVGRVPRQAVASSGTATTTGPDGQHTLGAHHTAHGYKGEDRSAEQGHRRGRRWYRCRADHTLSPPSRRFTHLVTHRSTPACQLRNSGAWPRPSCSRRNACSTWCTP